MRVVNLGNGRVQDWGVQDENRATQLRTDAETYVKEWPNGKSQAIFRRADGYTYNVPCEFDGHYVLVELTNTETCVAGTAKIEIQWIDGESVVKSDTYTGVIERSIGDAMGDRPPAPMAGYVDQMAKMSAEIMDAADRVENVAVSAPYIGDNGNWFLYNPETGEYEDSGKPSVSSGGGGDGVVVEF